MPRVIREPTVVPAAGDPLPAFSPETAHRDRE
jgi:hypothetical protein